MYRVLIVDDEPWALVVTRKIFDWDKNGFEIIAETTSPKKAIELISEQQPDVVFTDIRMPGLDGLELIKRIQEKKLDTEFVIVSGFAEFSYAQEALRNGALDYCLKPMDPSKTDELLQRIYHRLENKRILRNTEVIEALMNNSVQGSVLLHSFLQKHTSGMWLAMVAYAQSRVRLIQRLEGLSGCHAFEVKAGTSKNIFIVNIEENTPISELEEMLRSAGVISVGISSQMEQSEEISKLVKEAEIAAVKTFVNKERGIFRYTNNVQVLKPLLNRFLDGATGKKYNEMKDILDEIRALFISQDLGVGEAVYFWNQSVGMLLNYYSDQCDYLDLEFLNYSELINRFMDFESLCGYLQEVFSQLAQTKDAGQSDHNANTSFMEMVNHINSNYCRDLYLKDLAAKFFLNQFYCCELFKKNIGKSFSEYITGLRMEKACDLIKSSSLTIEKISEMVGYNDYYYFNKVFKKYCGTTPAKYRKSNMQSH